MTDDTKAADGLARACALAMWGNDAASRNLGMTLEQVETGRASLSMMVTASMVNGHAICHGGYIFTLGDSAFAFAANTHNQVTVAQQCTVSFLHPARLGDKLIATATERWRSGRSGLYDISVATAQGTMIAELRGHSRAIGGALLPESTGTPDVIGSDSSAKP
ncbi:hydroxyphenylacetyl-CoA thioesterase PaaI [Breoghania sp. L-A4]|uniref:hydroxyphenylacetyl-CoA thioesterase PaaI n=1 Tax=Breoghania sp. L-A4 TaxID=2304600 RepID=UPI000E360A48|nr:hydroxyphenylacetyl-CoA thioesterase PaaI [Breoghania sp. L-A4]AXS40345.1 hydroxyphenylacetyl-CoA thioesterase PaaI [Breoghania sp. L-A4]